MSSYLDGELALRRRARMDRHVEECHECRHLIAGLGRMLGLLQRLAPPSGGADAQQIAASVRLLVRESPPS